MTTMDEHVAALAARIRAERVAAGLPPDIDNPDALALLASALAAPRADDALTFDEAEAAGLDGTLRDM